MTDYDNSNSGVLFKNNKKDTNSHPYYKGSINVGGVEYWASGWVNTKKDNDEKYVSLKFTPKDEASNPSDNESEEDSPF